MQNSNVMVAVANTRRKGDALRHGLRKAQNNLVNTTFLCLLSNLMSNRSKKPSRPSSSGVLAAEPYKQGIGGSKSPAIRKRTFPKYALTPRPSTPVTVSDGSLLKSAPANSPSDRGSIVQSAPESSNSRTG